MPREDTGFEALLAGVDPKWRETLASREPETPDPRIEDSVYRAVFNTSAGQAVLHDMYNRYVNVTRWVPGAGEDTGAYREGMAQVVFDIVARLTDRGHEGEDQ